MLRYKVQIDGDALQDIQKATDWYNKRVTGLGSRFQRQVKLQINSLKHNPNLYANRYSQVRCMIIKKFPFMVHYKVDEINFAVKIFAVIHTSRNPKIWEDRSDKD